MQLALIGQAGNHRLRKALARSPDDRGLPSGGKAAAVIGPTGQAGLVGPLDFTAVRPGFAGNRRVGVLQPCPDRLILSLGGSPRWPLGSETPGPQIAADHRQGQPDPSLACDQRPHRLARPQRKRQTELIGTPPGDQDAQPVLLHRTQRFLLARATAPTPTRQDVLPALTIATATRRNSACVVEQSLRKSRLISMPS